MRAALMTLAALALFGLGAFAGQHFLSPQQPEQDGLFGNPALARAVLDAGAIELNSSDCALATQPGASTTVADFVLSYAAAAELPAGQSTLTAECGGRGDGKCSASYSIVMGEKADTNILLFTRDDDGKLIPEDVSCIAQ